MLRRFLPIFITAMALVSVANAQLSTNVQALDITAQGIRLRERSEYTKALSLAKQRNWPLTINGRNGARGVLVGVDAFNFPKYYITLNNSIAAATTRTNQLWPGGATGLNLTGSSANMKNKIGIWDGGRILNSHVELTGRITQKDNPTSNDNHATHVAGTMVATGLNPSAKGMAYGVQGMIAYDFNNDNSEIALEAAGLLISNHSYSIISGWNFNSAQNRWEFYGRPNEDEDYKFGYYSTDAQELDSIAYNAPFYLIVKSSGNNRGETGPAVGEPYFRFNAQNQMTAAGNRPASISSNDSYGTITWDGNAKNILTVGAVRGIPGGYNRPEDVVMSTFSSWGPTDDGRIKPDIVADGVNVLSTYATGDNSYSTLSGTSMSSPNAAGSLFLLQEHYSKLKSGAFLRSATIKGLAIHTADEAGPNPGPDYQNGWGLLNAQKAAAVISASVASNNGSTSEHLMFENEFNATTSSFSTTVIATGKEPLRATICWTDVKGNVESVNVLNNPDKKLINDLDIRITSGSRTFRPWTLNPAIPSNPAVKGDNNTDNVERIDIDSTVSGESYTITVTHKGSAGSLVRGQQAYSLLISGVGGVAHCSSSPSGNAGSRIDSVSLQTIRYANPAGGTTYVNNTAIAANIEPSQSVPFRVRVNSSDATNTDKIVKLFIDYNNDGDFIDANELVATSPVLKNNEVFAGSFTTPGNLTVGSSYRTRVVLVETATANDVTSCGNYARGETNDFRLVVVNPSTDFTISEVITPTVADCADNNQYLTINIRNNGSVSKSNIPISVEVKNGTTTVTTINATYPGTVLPLSNASFTLQTPFATTENTTYTILATTNISGDQNTANNTLSTSLTIGKKGNDPNPIGAICNSSALLRIPSPSANTNYFWYNSATATAPFAAGSTTSTTTIPTNKTFYVSSELKTSIGPANKMVYPNGGYNDFGGAFMRFTANVPLTIENARLYIGNSGKIEVMLARFGEYFPATSNFSFSRVTSTVLNVVATNPNPAPGAVSGNPANDTGAVYMLNLRVDQPGDYILMALCSDGATIFRNNGITGTTYPISVPNVASFTGNSVNVSGTGDPNPFYYFFYDMKIRTGNSCPSSRQEIVIADAPTPVVTRQGDSLVINAPGVSRQWFKDNEGISGATNPSYKPIASGNYTVITVDALGCQKTSAPIQFTVTSLPPEVVAREIKLSVSPNPNKGLFNLSFEVKEKGDVSIELLNSSGQRVFNQSYPGFNGVFSKQMNVGNINDGQYILKIFHNKKTYLQKMVIIK
jgi:hypothetical protein